MIDRTLIAVTAVRVLFFCSISYDLMTLKGNQNDTQYDSTK